MKHRPTRAAVVGLTIIGATGVLAGPAIAASAQRVAVTASSYSVLRDSLNKTTDVKIGAYHTGAMSVEVVLAPSHEAKLQGLLASVYSKHSKSFQHWLKKGQFDASFAPSRSEVSAVRKYLAASGLALQSSSSPFLVRATGSSTRVSSSFRTQLSLYRDPEGKTYFSNSTAVKLPTSLAGGVLGVLGLSNTVRLQSMVQRVPTHETIKATRETTKSSGARFEQPPGHPSHPGSHEPACETPYVTTAELFAYYADGTAFLYGYGGGPGCSGLTPSQDNSIYGAPNVGPRGQGAGVNAAVFELSAYQESDIDTWAQTFYGPRYNPPLVNITVDGGPLNPVCPVGDTCPPSYNGYAGDIEVDADIEMTLAISPDVRHLIVYNAPNDYTGQTELDEYTAIANQDIADTVSSSWAVCENDVSAAYVQAENEVFEQMALQGQSVFSSAGDTGAFECIRSDGTTIPNVLDPSSQPWVTSVGGTSFGSDNPGANPNPNYPPQGTETVWNVDNLCNTSAAEGPGSGLFWCAATGAGGGGSSQWWGRPSYQQGRGVNNPYTTYGNGTTQCALAKTGTPCREVPDISANADEYTPYAEYCTGNASTPYSVCGTFSGTETPPGWFGIGGTSLSSPLWAAIIADRDSFQGRRTGNANPLLYLLFNLAPNVYFHDITGFGQSTNNNGLFPVTPGYDEATGIGTPRMAALIAGSF